MAPLPVRGLGPTDLAHSPYLVAALPAGQLVDHVVSEMLFRVTPPSPGDPAFSTVGVPSWVGAIPSRVSPGVLVNVMDEEDPSTSRELHLRRLALHSSFVVGAREQKTVDVLASAAVSTRDWMDVGLNPLAGRGAVPVQQVPEDAALGLDVCRRYVLAALWRILCGPAPELVLRILQTRTVAGIAADNVTRVPELWESLDNAQRVRLVDALPDFLPRTTPEIPFWSGPTCSEPFRLGVYGWGCDRVGAARTGRALYDVIGDDPGLWDVAMEILKTNTRLRSINEWLDTVSALT